MHVSSIFIELFYSIRHRSKIYFRDWIPSGLIKEYDLDTGKGDEIESVNNDNNEL